MKIRNSLIILFSIVIIFTVGSISFLVFGVIIASNIDAELEDMTSKLNERGVQLQTLHSRANEDVVFALKNPKFVEYFELPETREGNVFENDVMQFTDNQREIKNDLEQWVFHFQNKFQVDETCLIDSTGQEHLRLVFQDIEVDEFLSSEEMGAPFFTPSFAQEVDEVYVQYPYFSPDSFRWVFAYTSPIVLNDGEKPAFYHFEMPVNIFQDIISIDHGRMYVIDPQEYLIADSAYSYPTKNISEEFEDYFPQSNSILQSTEFEKLQNQIKAKGSGNFQFVDEKGESQYIVFKKLSTFDWILVYQESESLMLSEFQTEYGSVFTTISLISVFVGIVSIIGIIIVSNKITKPIIELRNATKEAEYGTFESNIEIKGANELTELGVSFSKMFSSIKKTIELEKKLAVSEQKLKNERFAAIGELSARIAHDIRNPLNVIQAALENLSYSQNNPKVFEKSIKLCFKSVDRIAHQINNVMDFLRDSEIQSEENHLKEMIDGLISEMKIPDVIKINLPENNVVIQGDKIKLEALFSNLIINAVQKLEKNGIITIRISEKEKNTVQIEIEDNGKSIPDENLEKIFEPLFTTKQTGTGLGLASCKKIVEQHGGSISAKNNPTTFTILLPTGF